MIDIHALIADLGVTVEYVTDLPPGRLGEYHDDDSRIRVRHGLTAAQETETLHHEYNHALHRDRSTHSTLEHRAKPETARMLVDPDRYAAAEAISADAAHLARELGTTITVVEDHRTYWLQDRMSPGSGREQ